ncbi:MAG: GNAT family N-acetyltransferase [Oscillospiraceae bacterium]
MEITIRNLIALDINDFPKEFALQGWTKPAEQFQKYYEQQLSGKRKVFVATVNEKVAGYATLLPNDCNGPFKDKNIPTICDFNVLEKFQSNGIGTMILEAIEADVKTHSPIICLGVGLHNGYGSAQRMYIKRGYVPDGSGVWYNNENLAQNAQCYNNDDLVLYMSKKLI